MAEPARRTVYPARLQFRVPADVAEAVVIAARSARCGAGEYARQLILAGLESKGVELPPVVGA